MVPPRSIRIPALALALLVLLGILALYTTEASAVRATVRDTRVYNAPSTRPSDEMIDFAVSSPPFGQMPGLPY